MRQIQREDLGVIRFTSVPRGGAPLWVREAWIGVEVPCLFLHDGVPLSASDTVHDVETGFEVPDFPGYIVLQTHAIEALLQQSPAAVEYWLDLGCPSDENPLFLFDHESAEVVRPVMTRGEFWRCFNDA
ncbi:MAG: hypothetical protein KBC83_02640 [Candidatus Moranbacteria bacterium]|nr:hypothetical protein [Candidatus Moranbacteria bacterium]